MCPSAMCSTGAVLLGIVGEDGNVSYAKDRIEIDQDFVDRAEKDGRPRTKFRFAHTCVEHDCLLWDGTTCGVPKTAHRYLGSGEGTSSLQPCPIRPECRWFRQEGPSACRICPTVITQTSANITLQRMFGSLPPEVVSAVTVFFGLGESSDAEALAVPAVRRSAQQELADAGERTA